MTIVYVDIVGDLFHYGHVNFFRQAREFGDVLIVGLMSDTECENYKRKPILNVNERKQVIQSCRYVDKVIVNPPMPITKTFLENNNIDIVCHSDDMDEESLNYWYNIPIQMNKFRKTLYSKDISTSEIISRVKKKISKDC